MALARHQFTVTDDLGNIVPGAHIEVRREVPGQPLAALKSDRAGADSLSNPFDADENGFAGFHVFGGAYQITATLGAFSQTWRFVAIGTGAESDLGSQFADRGVFDIGETYAKWDLVAGASASFVYVNDEPGAGHDLPVLPDMSNDYWQQIARGTPGPSFEPDAVVAALADRDAFDDEPENFSVLVRADSSNDNLPTLYFKVTATHADWDSGFTFSGGGDVAGDTHAAASKATPADADELPIVDSAASNVLKKLTWANLRAALASTFLSAGLIREKLTADRIYYVRTDGNDSNTGLANTSGGAFLTIQKAINVVAALDISIYDVTIQIADGTYTGNIVANGPWLGSGRVILSGNQTTPANVVINPAGGDGPTAKNGAQLVVSGMELRSGSSGQSLRAEYNGFIEIGANMRFGAATNGHTYVAMGGIIFGRSPYAIVGGAAFHLQSALGGRIDVVTTITLTGTPAIGVFASATVGSVIQVFGTFSGSATGARYSASGNSVIFTNGSGMSYLPGSTASVTPTSTGGQYI